MLVSAQFQGMKNIFKKGIKSATLKIVCNFLKYSSLYEKQRKMNNGYEKGAY